jgi:hypothetical protein
MLFVAALIATGVLMAVAVGALDQTGMAGPWLVPVIAVLCQTTAFYLGRHHILPRTLAASATKSALTVIATVALTLAVATAGGWAVQWAVGRDVVAPALTLLLWFALLWLAVGWQQNWNWTVKNSVR